MKNGLVIADSGAIFSLAITGNLGLLDSLFNSVKIPVAVWQEITLDKTNKVYKSIFEFFENKVVKINSFNELTFVMDYGESESVILYRELNASFLLIDDKKARNIAENFGLNCIGTLGLLSVARQKGIVSELRPIFLTFLKNKRFYSLKLLNSILLKHGENILDGRSTF